MKYALLATLVAVAAFGIYVYRNGGLDSGGSVQDSVMRSVDNLGESMSDNMEGIGESLRF